MKGRVFKRGKTWSYVFDIEPDPLTGKRRQLMKGGFGSEKEAWRECRSAMANHETGRLVKPSNRTVEQALNDWLTRIQHSVKPSMWQNWRNYADHYVIPYIGKRKVQDIDGEVLDALYAKLRAEGRVKAKPKKAGSEDGPKKRRATKRKPVKPLPPGLAPKTIVNAHRMLHRAWVDFERWKWVHRNVVKDAHAPSVPRTGRKVWTVAQLRTFLEVARRDRFYALWVLEATSGFRRCELAGAQLDGLDLETGTLTIEVTRVVVDGKVVLSDGKTENAQRTIALDPFTLAVLRTHVEQLGEERKEFGPDYQDEGWLFCWENGKAPHPDTITRRFKRLAESAGLPAIDLHDVRHSYATAGRDARIDWKALSVRIGHADVAFTMKRYVQSDLEADRRVATTLAELIVGGSLASPEVTPENVQDHVSNSVSKPQAERPGEESSGPLTW